MKKFVRVLALALAVLMIAALAGCAKTPASSTSPASEAPSSAAPAESQQPDKDYKDTKFTIAWWGNDARNNATTQLIEEFEKAYPNLKIDVVFADWNGYWTAIQTRAASKTLPDVMQMDYGTIATYAGNNQLLALDDLIKNGSIDLTNAKEDSISAGKLNGKMYGIVTGVNSPTGLYNPEILKEAGVTLSKTPTLEEFNAASKTVYEKTGAFTDVMGLLFFIRIHGMNPHSDDGKSVGYTAEVLKKYWEYLDDGYNVNGYFANPNSKYDYETPAAAFAAKALWIDWDYSNKIMGYEDESGLQMEMMVLPSTDACKNGSYMKPNMLWSVSANTENQELAAAFLNYFVNEAKTYEVCGIDRGMPISSKIRETIAPTMTGSQKKFSEFLTFIEENNSVSAIYSPEPTATGECNSVLNEIWEKIQYGQVNRADFASLAEETIKKLNDILAKGE